MSTQRLLISRDPIIEDKYLNLLYQNKITILYFVIITVRNFITNRVHVSAFNNRFREEGTRKKDDKYEVKYDKKRGKSTRKNVQMKQYKNKERGNKHKKGKDRRRK